MSTVSRDMKTQARKTLSLRRLPTISVVAIVGSDIVPGGWIAELAKRCAQIGAELIVVMTDILRPEVLGMDHEALQIVYGEASSSHVELRARGIEAAQGDIVLFVQERELIDATAVKMLVHAGLGRGGVQPLPALETKRVALSPSSPSAASTVPAFVGILYQETRDGARESAV